ncbi:hypothetical protein LWI29_013775 [Acer saccharum]|uniref:Reverse transcriptase domain-containing protein n=1 Tax=Acer saccharum TaxID=4024 RepID=A0AA39VGI8_ACESA|nr:hypothetical protein LWI29_013775 [Acer saccharum]
MDSIIGETQMAFVAKRQIMDSFVIAKEVIKKWRRDKEAGLLVKLDFEKAYDSVDHGYLDYMMEGMGFGAKWRGWIKECISFSSLFVLMNGRPTPQFGMEKGLRQGDPISPLLFNIVVEDLNGLFLKVSRLGLIEGERFDDSKVHITHLQFTDDTILFLKPRMEFVLNAKRILRCFKLASGLKINSHKSCVVQVGIGRDSMSPRWEAAFRCKQASLPITYLGFPLGGRPGSKNFWNSLVSRIENRLTPWKRKFLSKGGRLVLIKSVILSIPIYFLSIFKIPIGVAMRIEKLQRGFFMGRWGYQKKTSCCQLGGGLQEEVLRWVRICLRLVRAELWAIKRATELIAANPNLNGRDITVVSDSKVAVSWVNQGVFGNIAQFG